LSQDPVTAQIAIEALKATIAFIASKAKPKIKTQILNWKTSQQAEKLQANIRQIGKITTIASREASTIDEIYYPSRIKHGRAGSRIVTFASDLVSRNSRVTLIIGTAGQGKSVLLRYLCLRDLDIQGQIPLFIELRKVDADKSITTLLHDHLVSLGIGEENPDEILKTLLNSGKSRIFLDGYDEVSREYSLRTKAEITRLVRDHPELEVLITSRPGAISQHLSDSFDINQHEVAPISPNEYAAFFQKIGVEAETKQRLINAITRSKAEIKALLSTPLMLTLLVKTCSTQQDLPDTLPEFYDSLFNVLASTHDGTKPGYVRQKATSLGNTELEKLFCTFSFTSKEIYKRNSLSHRQFEDSITHAIKISDVKCSLEGFKTDITETICLMVKDGLDTAFIHKSIQEYYAARFIHTLDNKDQAREILKAIGNNIFQWISEIQFLEDFKDHAYENIIGIPHAQELLNEILLKSKNKNKETSPKKLNKFLSSFDISASRSKETKEIKTISWTHHRRGNLVNRYQAELVQLIIHDIITSAPISIRPDAISDSLEIIQLVDLIKDNLTFHAIAISSAKNYCDKLEKRMLAMIERQARQTAGLLALLHKPAQKNSASA